MWVIMDHLIACTWLTSDVVMSSPNSRALVLGRDGSLGFAGVMLETSTIHFSVFWISTLFPNNSKITKPPLITQTATTLNSNEKSI